MNLLTAELRQQLPEIYATDEIDINEKEVLAKFFYPAGIWTWFVVEGSQEGDDFWFFGYIVGDSDEWGYFSLKELEGLNVNGLTVEQDLFFKPGKFKDVIARFWKERLQS